MLYTAFAINIFLAIASVLYKKYQQAMLFIQGLLLFLLAAFRFGIGPDYLSYKYLFHTAPSLFTSDFFKSGPQEIGYQFLESLFKTLGISYQIYLAVFAAIIIIYVIRTCWSFSSLPVVSFSLFFAIYSIVWVFSGIRQGLTLFIGLYYFLNAHSKADKKSFIKLVVVCLLLLLVHMSSVMYLVLFAITRFRMTKKKIIIVIAVSFLVSLLPFNLLMTKLSWFPFHDRIAPYLDKQTTFMLLDFKSFARFALWIIVYFFYDITFRDDQFKNKLFLVYTSSIVIYFLLKSSELIAARMSLYGKVVEIILFAEILQSILQTKRLRREWKIVCAACLVIFSMLYYGKELHEMKRQTGMQTEGFLTPYVSIFTYEQVTFDNRYFDLINTHFPHTLP